MPVPEVLLQVRKRIILLYVRVYEQISLITEIADYVVSLSSIVGIID